MIIEILYSYIVFIIELLCRIILNYVSLRSLRSLHTRMAVRVTSDQISTPTLSLVQLGFASASGVFAFHFPAEFMLHFVDVGFIRQLGAYHVMELAKKSKLTCHSRPERQIAPVFIPYSSLRQAFGKGLSTYLHDLGHKLAPLATVLSQQLWSQYFSQKGFNIARQLLRQPLEPTRLSFRISTAIVQQSAS